MNGKRHRFLFYCTRLRDGIRRMADATGDALRAAMMHGTAAMGLSDPHLPDCPMVAVNPALTKVTGYSAERSVGRNCGFLQGCPA